MSGIRALERLDMRMKKIGVPIAVWAETMWYETVPRPLANPDKEVKFSADGNYKYHKPYVGKWEPRCDESELWSSLSRIPQSMVDYNKRCPHFTGLGHDVLIDVVQYMNMSSGIKSGASLIRKKSRRNVKGACDHVFQN